MGTVIRELFSGEVLYRQGDPSDCAWLIERGGIELTSEQGRRSVHHGTLGPGELIGELGMLDGQPRSATATARGDTQLLAIDHDQFLERLDGGDAIVRTLVLSLLRRTRAIIAAMPQDVHLPSEDLATESNEERGLEPTDGVDGREQVVSDLCRLDPGVFRGGQLHHQARGQIPRRSTPDPGHSNIGLPIERRE